MTSVVDTHSLFNDHVRIQDPSFVLWLRGLSLTRKEKYYEDAHQWGWGRWRRQHPHLSTFPPTSNNVTSEKGMPLGFIDKKPREANSHDIKSSPQTNVVRSCLPWLSRNPEKCILNRGRAEGWTLGDKHKETGEALHWGNRGRGEEGRERQR